MENKEPKTVADLLAMNPDARREILKPHMNNEYLTADIIVNEDFGFGTLFPHDMSVQDLCSLLGKSGPEASAEYKTFRRRHFENKTVADIQEALKSDNFSIKVRYTERAGDHIEELMKTYVEKHTPDLGTSDPKEKQLIFDLAASDVKHRIFTDLQLDPNTRLSLDDKNLTALLKTTLEETVADRTKERARKAKNLERTSGLESETLSVMDGLQTRITQHVETGLEEIHSGLKEGTKQIAQNAMNRLLS